MIYKFLLISCFAVSVNLFFAEEINKSNLFDYFDNKNYLSAEFTQRTLQDGNERTVKGTIKAVRDGKFKIIYFEPMQEVIGSDGKSIFRLDYELEQMDVLPQEDYFKNTPISIFTSDVSSLSSLYQISYCDMVENTTICEIAPKSNDAFLEKLFLYFRNFELEELSYTDSFGQTVTLSFFNLSWRSFPNEDLEISIPKEIDIVYH